MTPSQFPKLDVAFLGCSKDPIEILYSAYKINHSQEDIPDIWKQIQEKSISRDEMTAYLPGRPAGSYPSSLRQAQFVFLVDNISRTSASSLSRYANEPDKTSLLCADLQIKHGKQHSVTPPSFRQHQKLVRQWIDLQSQIAAFYQNCLEQGIDPDDAGFALPQGLICREQISMSFQAMQSFLDTTLCEETPWEIREMAWQIFGEMKKEFPTLSERLGIKCWENRSLFCNEPYKRYRTCKWNQTRPHKNHLDGIWRDGSHPASEKLTM